MADYFPITALAKCFIPYILPVDGHIDSLALECLLTIYLISFQSYSGFFAAQSSCHLSLSLSTP